jgi:diguanylate cyclase (GGDEF)-like protein
MRRHDELTGLPNRVAFQVRVRALRQRNVAGSLAVIDLDHFKSVNDRYGHSAGDAALRIIAARLQATVTADIVVARYGGEEFVLFVPGSADRARTLLDRLQTVMRQPMEYEAFTISVTASVGLSALPLSTGLDQGLSAADLAMYVAKSEGRDRVLEFSEDTAGVITARRELAKTVVSLRERTIRLEQQVQMDALTGLRSRRALDDVLGTVCGGADVAAAHCSVAFLDIDHFGQYNHHHGDEKGDDALRQVARIIQSVARRGDMVFRKGGEEMVVVLPGATQHEALQAAERMRVAVEQAAIRHNASPTASVITVTVGVASSHGSAPVTVQLLMERAAGAAMQAKVQARRNQVHVA